MCCRPDIVYVVTSGVYDDYTRLLDSGVFPCSPGWRRTCIDRERAALATGNRDEAQHWRMVLEFGFRYGCDLAAAIEVGGQFFREAELPFDIPADMLKRVVIGSEPFSLSDLKHPPLRLLTEARP